MSLTIAPIGLRAANAYVTDLHRHELDAGWRPGEGDDQ